MLRKLLYGSIVVAVVGLIFSFWGFSTLNTTLQTIGLVLVIVGAVGFFVWYIGWYSKQSRSG